MSPVARPSPSGDKVHDETPATLDGIEAAIKQLEAALTSDISGESNQSAFLAVHHDRLADLYYSKYGMTGSSNDLHAARLQSSIASSLGREATENAPPGYSQVSQWCALQGSRLAIRYDRFGERKDLDGAIDAYEKALQTLTEGSTLQSVILMNQANCLCTRYEAEGSVEDIQEAVRKTKIALAAAGGNTVTIQNDLSTMYLSKYEKEGEIEDLEQAIELAEKAVESTMSNDPRLSTRLLNLANALSARYDCNEEFKACNASCMPQVLSCLAHALYLRYTREKVLSDLFDAIYKGEEALKMVKNASNGAKRHVKLKKEKMRSAMGISRCKSEVLERWF
ncbi:hypothetical protein K432DRAFT_159740 [Lepidopterella palustris CBS 459.81]|uniref:TPR-like protein n=1 Tax=Lepidopterella palustris CBS 459.81 TaxID=1314670 RepID=A0A8E2JIL9_9PEZI|nr:hypothetical protein K432DRAFT_159740 [Lepidopterella palustris CBS 459.81]